jgi:predicted porin
LDAEIYGVHAGYVLNDKTTLNLRYEFGVIDDLAGSAISAAANAESLAVGLTYDLWENVVSRVEYQTRSADGATDDDTLALNLVYSF